jgi:DNA replication ATP-dependent helicase Dna2
VFSGKTTTIVCIIRLLVQQGKTVLLTSYTHTAVDNVLLKLEESGIDFIRLGRAENIHPALKKYSFDITPANSVKEFEGTGLPNRLTDNQIFWLQNQLLQQLVLELSMLCLPKSGSTFVLWMKQAKLRNQVGDVEIISLVAVCLGPLRYANVFVLVGDHYQVSLLRFALSGISFLP